MWNHLSQFPKSKRQKLLEERTEPKKILVTVADRHSREKTFPWTVFRSFYKAALVL